jgi:hypothetical protein
VIGAVTATEAAAGTTAAAAHGATAGTAATAGGMAAAPSALGFATKALTAKILLGVALGGSTVAAGSWWATHRSADKPAVMAKADLRPSPAPAPAPEPVPAEPPAEAPVVDPCESPSATPCATAATPSTPERVAKSADTPRRRYLLGVESRLLTEARAELRRGDARAAMSTLERLQTRFPNGVLMQEREVLTIEVLAASGDTAGARKKARDFLRAYPNSPHAEQVRRFTGEP